jgi:DNA processing protein
VVIEDSLPWLVLARAFGFSTGLRPGSPAGLLDCGLDTQGWLALSDAQLAEQGVKPAQRQRLLDPEAPLLARQLLDRTAAAGLGLVWRGNPLWPASLLDLPGAPAVLWFRGRIDALTAPSIAVVGTRTPTPYGAQAAKDFAEGLVIAGMTVISGLARGIDGAAHRVTLEAHGSTIAVLGSAIDCPYPSEHASLLEQIVDGGGLALSEYPPGYRANPGTFPKRNRLLAALSQGVLVIEAGRRSGALITCDWALQYDRPVWAVPGPHASPLSAGCHRIVREGALLADSPASLLKDLGVALPGQQIGDGLEVFRSADEAHVLQILRRSPNVVDAIATELRKDVGEVTVLLGKLELRGLVESRAGGVYFTRDAS